MFRNRTNKSFSSSDRATAAPPLAWIIPNATVFVSSACIMAIEIVAGRIISRHLGASIYTWTSVIGIVLAGIAVGNYLGGRIADRHSSKQTLAKMFMAAAAAAVAIIWLDNLAADFSTLWMLAWPVRVACHVAIAFFIPTAVLGMISPIVAKMALDLGRAKGRTIGDIYAWGVIGSIVGTFLAGFYLIAALGTKGLVWSVAGALAVMAVLYWRTTWKTWTWAGVVALLAFLATGSVEWASSIGERLELREPPSPGVLYSKETQYSHIKIIQVEADPDTRAMYLDTLLHSEIDMQNPANFHYDYEEIYAAITNRLRPNARRVDSLTIGGGGYVYPRFMQSRWPGSRTDVAEIDPIVTEASMLEFGLPRDTSIGCYHEDGRIFIDRMLRRKAEGRPVEPYDFIYCDAVNDYNVPYQLTTLEFMTHVRQLIKPDGAYLMNMIDIYESGLLLGALVNTMKRVFPHVYVFLEGLPVEKSRAIRNTFIIAGMNHPFDTNNLGAEFHPDCKIFTMTDDQMAELETKTGRRVLTDRFSPVENLLAPVVKDAAKAKAAGEWQWRAFLAAQNRDYDRAIDICRNALKLFSEEGPLALPLLYGYGEALRHKGDLDEAVAKYKKAVRMNPDYVKAHIGLIQCYAALDEEEYALPHYRRVLEFRPLDTNTRYNLGRVLLTRGRYDQAAREFAEVCRLKPDMADAWNNWGAALLQLGKIDAALDKLQQAIEVDPTHPGGQGNLKIVRAIKPALDVAVRRHDDAKAHLELGKQFYDARLAALALRSFSRAVELAPEHVEANLMLGNALAALGQLQSAIDAYVKVVRLDPSRQDIQKRIDDLRQRLRQALPRNP